MPGSDKPERAKDPHLANRYVVDIEGVAVAGFSEVTGLDFESEVESFRVGGQRTYEEQLAGQTKFPSRLVLKRGIADTDALWKWHQDVVEGRIVRRKVTIVLNDSTGAKQRKWAFREAAPVKWVGPQLRGAASEIAIETLELVHRGCLPE